MDDTLAKTTPDSPEGKDTAKIENGKRIRVTQAGKMRVLVKSSLDWLCSGSSHSVTLHTAPDFIEHPERIASTSKLPLPAATPASDGHTDPETQSKHHSETRSSKKAKTGSRSGPDLMPCTSTLPKLISVVEIVKREYFGAEITAESDDAARISADQERLLQGRRRLWQYNRLVNLRPDDRNVAYPRRQRKGNAAEGNVSEGAEQDGQPLGLSAADDELRRMLSLSGRQKHPQMLHTPYMEITISTRPLHHLQALKDVTYQVVNAPKRKERKQDRNSGPRKKKSTNTGRGKDSRADSGDKSITEEDTSMIQDSMG